MHHVRNARESGPVLTLFRGSVGPVWFGAGVRVGSGAGRFLLPFPDSCSLALPAWEVSMWSPRAQRGGTTWTPTSGWRTIGDGREGIPTPWDHPREGVCRRWVLAAAGQGGWAVAGQKRAPLDIQAPGMSQGADRAA